QKDTETTGSWSIGIYEGSSPFYLADPKDISNPVLTKKDVVDIDATFVADPFMVINEKKHFMFFEVLNRETNQGDIAYAESMDGKKWNYKKVVIDEEFHLSYPYVFEWNNSYYLIPESNKDSSVRLYKATKFPESWEYLDNLLFGYRYVDPTIFRYEDKWWMFVSTEESNVLNLYYSKELLTGWRPHPMNPVVKFDKNFSRPGGRVIVYEDKLYRLTQDDDPSYGVQVFAFEITKLSETSYEDKLASKTPIVTKTGIGWNAAGMHHVDLHKIENKWISAVDGRSK
ncbi:MAG: hypothetical protein KAR06_01710, partial [Deltaproteobacteria bacterium]|nr:hypothetical protein [Deltaproteobacteria bacterium]